MGNMPIIIASAVITTARRRVAPEWSAASAAVMPSCKCVRAKLTTSTEFAVATPRLMIAPMSAGTLSVVCVTHSAHTTPASAPGSALTMMKGSSQLWKFTTSSR